MTSTNSNRTAITYMPESRHTETDRKRLLPCIERLLPFDSLITSWMATNQIGTPSFDPEGFSELLISFPGDPYDSSIDVTASILNPWSVELFVEFTDPAINTVEQYVMTLDELVTYLDQLPKPVFHFAQFVAEDADD